MTTTRAAGRDKPPERQVDEDRVTVARLRRQLDQQGTELAELRTAYAELLATMTQTTDHDQNEEPTSHGRNGRSSSTSGGANRQRLENPLLTWLRPPGGRIGRAFWYASILLMSFSGPWLGFEMIQRASGNAFDLPFTLFSLGVATVAWVNTSSPLNERNHWQRRIVGGQFCVLGIAMSGVGVFGLALLGLRWPLQHMHGLLMLQPGLLVDLNGTEEVAALATGVAALALYDLMLPRPSGEQASPSGGLPRRKAGAAHTGRFTPPGTKPRSKSVKGRRRRA